MATRNTHLSSLYRLPGLRHGLFAVLVVATVLWGCAVAAHHHLDLQQDLCEICLLPHAANAAPAAVEIAANPFRREIAEPRIYPWIAQLTPCYQSRAPPR